MLEDMENNFDAMLFKNQENFQKTIESLKNDKQKLENEKNKLEEENKVIRKKIFTPSSNSNADFSNKSFKESEKDKVGQASLYESIIVHIKTLNVKYLLEIFDFNIQREEEIRGILDEKMKGKQVTN